MSIKVDILNYLKGKDWTYIDDIAIDLLQLKSKKETAFDLAYKSLVSEGRLELLGNQVKIID